MWITLLWGCGSTEDPTVPIAVEVRPSEVTVSTGPDGAEAVPFVAWATWSDGSTGELDNVAWSVSNASAGDIDEHGGFAPSADNGGTTWVQARLAEMVGVAVVTVIYEDVINDESVDPDRFSGLESPWDEAWLYPHDGVAMPRNAQGVAFQWNPAGEAYRLRLSSEVTDLTIYTTSRSYDVDAELWGSVAAANSGGAVEVELAAVAADGTLLVADPLDLEVSRLDASGSIVYWSSSAEGVLEIPFGEQARDILTTETTGECVGCHALSPDGALAYSFEGGDGPLGAVDLETGDTLLSRPDGYSGNFKAFSPDGSVLVVTLQGALQVLDAQTFETLGEVDLGTPATHPDFAPDGELLAVVLSDEFVFDFNFRSGRIAVVEHLGGAGFGEPRVLFTPPAGQNAYYPAFSPDGAWIAFNVSDGESYDDDNAALWLVSVDGGEAIELARANQGPGLSNSWPRWAPAPDGDLSWLAFASRRDYGFVATGIPQIWVAGIDPSLAEQGEDPSWPAFWLPGQDATQNNHLPLWSD